MRRARRQGKREQLASGSRANDELPTTYAPRSADNFELITNVDSLRQHGGTITGYVAFRLNDEVFPSAFWNDFIVRLVSSWANDLADLFGTSSTKQWLFMDGPYELRVVRDRTVSTWSLQGFDRNRSCTKPLRVDPSVVLREFIDRGRELLSACDRHGWTTSDVVKLRSAIERLARG